MYEVFIVKEFSIDGFSTCAIIIYDVTALDEVERLEGVEDGALVVQVFTGDAFTFLPSAQSPKVLRCLRCVIVQLKDNPPHRIPVGTNVHENVWKRLNWGVLT